MSLPPVVSDPEGPCPERETPMGLALPHDWFKRWSNNALGALRGRGWKEYEVCRFCGGRKP